jgi:hypothetical protein
MIYFLTALSLFTFLALCGASNRIKKAEAQLEKAEEHIEIIRVALERHLIDGTEYKSAGIGTYKGKWRAQFGDRIWDGNVRGDA